MDLLKPFTTLCVVVGLTFSSVAAAQNLSVEEIVSKHLNSIGSKEKREQIKNQFAVGTSEFESKLPARKTTGKTIIVSDSNNLFFVSSFASREYPFEKIGYFKDKVNLPFVTAGTRSPLGAFISDHSKILSDGLLAGSASMMWNLLGAQNLKGRFDPAGSKKIDGRKTYAVNYFPKNVGTFEMSVKLYFDAETFQHVRTEYRRTLTPKDQPFGTLGTQGGVQISVIEAFGDFKTVNNLTLPHSYKINYTTDSNSGTYEYNWSFNISQYLFNQNLDANFFTFDEK